MHGQDYYVAVYVYMIGNLSMTDTCIVNAVQSLLWRQ